MSQCTLSPVRTCGSSPQSSCGRASRGPAQGHTEQNQQVGQGIYNCRVSAGSECTLKQYADDGALHERAGCRLTMLTASARIRCAAAGSPVRHMSSNSWAAALWRFWFSGDGGNAGILYLSGLNFTSWLRSRSSCSSADCYVSFNQTPPVQIHVPLCAAVQMARSSDHAPGCTLRSISSWLSWRRKYMPIHRVHGLLLLASRRRPTRCNNSCQQIQQCTKGGQDQPEILRSLLKMLCHMPTVTSPSAALAPAASPVLRFTPCMHVSFSLHALKSAAGSPIPCMCCGFVA